MPDSRLVVALTRRLLPITEQALADRYDLRLPAGEGPPSPAELRALFSASDIVVATVGDQVTGESIPEHPRTRLLANYGVGMNHIDLPAIRAAGMLATNTPGVLTDATAELAITLMLMTARRAGEGERQLRAGRWGGWAPTHLPGTSLCGRQLGIVGMGRIGLETARRAAAGLGMSIRYFSRSEVPAERLIGLAAVRVADLDELLREAHVISLHCPLTPATHHLIDERRLALMRPDALLINTARGAVVDEAALARALAAGSLAGCGLDVYEHEPTVHPDLLRLERAVLLPHLGSATVEARTAMGDLVLANIAAWAAGERPPNLVN